MDLGHRADRRSRRGDRPALVYGDRRRYAADVIDLRLLHSIEKLAGVGREALDVAPLPLGVQNVEREGRLPGPTHARDDRKLIHGDVDVEALQVVLTGAADLDIVVRHETLGERATIVRIQTSCTSRLAGFPAVRERVELPHGSLILYVVPDLEALVDRGAVLRGEAEPPYWAYLWAGARVLAVYATRRMSLVGVRVLEIGCGLGLPGVAAAAAGAAVTFVDRAEPALAFVRASLDANGLQGDLRGIDYRELAADERFDLILAAEVAYEREGFAELAAFFGRHLAPGGRVVMADGFRTNTLPLYQACARERLASAAVDCRIVEEGRAAPLRLVLLQQAAS